MAFRGGSVECRGSPRGAGFRLRVGKGMQMSTVFSCVVDAKPKFSRQALLWAASLLIHGEQDADSLVVHTIGECDPLLKELLDNWGVRHVSAAPFDERHP